MAFNHYVKLAKIFQANPGCKIKRIEQETRTKRFDGSYNYYDHYYRLVDKDGNNIKYGKFQQLDRLAAQLQVPVEQLALLIIFDE